MRLLHCGPYRIDVTRPRIMAIINLTPDSFSGDGLKGDRDAALRRAERAIAEGADILDLGGESTRPGAAPVAAQEEMDRVLPVLEELVKWGLPVSIDTFKPALMREALSLGVALINDIHALERPGAVELLAATDAGICLMHMQGEPETMQSLADYPDDDVVDSVRRYLQQRVLVCQNAGIQDDRILLDPGFGFGKTVAHNFSMLRHFDRFCADGFPVLAALSRKSMLGAITGVPPAGRVTESVTGALLAAQRGAAMLRVHDVAATRAALAVWEACEQAA